MSLITGLVNEIKQEAQGTRRILERVPEAQMAWQPHPKSYTLSKLVNHIADLMQWVPIIVSNTEFDFTTGIFQRCNATTQLALLENFERHVHAAIAQLQAATEEALQEKWKLRRADIVMIDTPRKLAIRYMCLNHLVHHRGQLSVYLRLLDVPVPGLYGPSADEK